MNDTKDSRVKDGIERVERVDDYFKRLFVRTLKLALDDGAREGPWEQLLARADRAGQ